MYPLEEIQLHEPSTANRNNSSAAEPSGMTVDDALHSSNIQNDQRNSDRAIPQPTIDSQNYLPSSDTSGYDTQPPVHDSHGGPYRNILLQSDPKTNLECLAVVNLTTKGNLVQAPDDDNDRTERKVLVSEC